MNQIPMRFDGSDVDLASLTITRYGRTRPAILCTCLHCKEGFLVERFRAVEPGRCQYCSMKCYGLARANHTPDKFWKLINKKSNGCWEFALTPTFFGYGTLKVNGKARKAHRHAWILTHGEIPKGMSVCHTCDNPNCINPAHLFLGTAFDNMQDMAKKGRAAGFKRKGENHPLAKYKDSKVRKILSQWIRRSPGVKANTMELSKKYNVGEGYIYANYKRLNTQPK